MNNTVKKGTQSDNDVWVLHRTKDIKALVNALIFLKDILEKSGHNCDITEAVKPFVKQNKNE